MFLTMKKDLYLAASTPSVDAINVTGHEMKFHRLL